MKDRWNALEGGETSTERSEDPVREVLLERQFWKVETVAPNSTVLEALAVMERRNIGAIVVAEGEDIVGIISERDCARKVLLEGKDPGRTTVASIMSCEVCFATANKKVFECLELMLRRHIRHLPILFGRYLVGCVSLRNLMEYCYGVTSMEGDSKEVKKSGLGREIQP